MDSLQEHELATSGNFGTPSTLATDTRENQGNRKLAARRAIEDHLDRRRMERQLDSYFDNI